MELQGKTAIVTGAGRGIGEGIAMVLAREGANVVLTARKIDEVAAVAKRIEAQGGRALPLTADASKKADVQAMAAATVKQFGAIDILVNNAGRSSGTGCWTST
jgi:3-oxoacyl-[acyl-carrier protein] reductase